MIYLAIQAHQHLTRHWIHRLIYHIIYSTFQSCHYLNRHHLISSFNAAELQCLTLVFIIAEL